MRRSVPGRTSCAWCSIAAARRRGSASNGFPVGAVRDRRVGRRSSRAAARDIGPSLFVKACEGGYDGRSQLRLDER